VRILFRNYNVSEGTKQQLLYGVAVLICIVSVFGIVLFMAYFSEDPSKGGFPSPTPGVFSNLAAQGQNGQVAGAQTQQQQQQPPPQNPSVGPDMPPPVPSPSPSPSSLPSPSPLATPPPATNNSTPTPTPSPSQTPNPTPTPTPPPPTPSNLQVNTSCNGTNPKNDLTWNSSNGATSYKVYRNGEVISSGTSSTSYTDNNVTGGNSYLYFIRAVNSSGESGDSNSQTVNQAPCASPSPSPSPSPNP
jgi:outer membrane biosynthesis protein TonB